MRSCQVRLSYLTAILTVVSTSNPAVLGQRLAAQRGVAPVELQKSPLGQRGPYYALAIGIDSYRYLPPLTTAVSDANAIAEALEENYGFQVKVLADATRGQILSALEGYESELPDNASLLIYYAGHGSFVRETAKYYWIPADARLESRANWIIADDITGDIKAIPARHILVVSDSCYSGTLNRDIGATKAQFGSDRYLAKMLAENSWNLMASGADEPVPDGGAPGHSVFAYALLRGLSRTDKSAFTALDLFVNYIQEKVVIATGQKPQYGPLPQAGLGYGDFVFFRSQDLRPPDLGHEVAQGGRADVGAAAPAEAQKQAQAQKENPVAEQARQHEEKSQFADLRQIFDQGLALNNQKQYAEAAAMFQKAEPLAKDKNLLAVLENEAAAYSNAKMYDQAIATYQKLIAANPNQAAFHNELGTTYANMGKVSEAQAEFQKAADLDPAGAAQAYYNLGAIMSNAGKMDEAAEAFKKATVADPRYADAYFLEGQALMGKATRGPDGKVVPAPGTLEALQTYLQLDPNGKYAATAQVLIQSITGQVQTEFKAQKKKS